MPTLGRVKALVGGNLLTALRTAAASSVSIKHLAPKKAKVLGMIGAGHQSTFQMRAAVEQREFEKIIGWNYHPEMLTRLADLARELDLPFEAVELDQLGDEADVIISITSAFAPSLLNKHVTGGTHIACMGTDTKGKQEVEAALVARATVFTDEVAQAVSIGECQHAVSNGTLSEADINELGSVINGDHAGRRSEDELTLFDGTGVGLQDLAVASAVVDLAVEKGVAIEVDFLELRSLRFWVIHRFKGGLGLDAGAGDLYLIVGCQNLRRFFTPARYIPQPNRPAQCMAIIART